MFRSIFSGINGVFGVALLVMRKQGGNKILLFAGIAMLASALLLLADERLHQEQ